MEERNGTLACLHGRVCDHWTDRHHRVCLPEEMISRDGVGEWHDQDHPVCRHCLAQGKTKSGL